MNFVRKLSTSISTAIPKIYSAATTAASDFRKILFQSNQPTGPSSKPLGFLVKAVDIETALKPLNDTIDTTEYIEPTLKHILSLDLQSKAEITKYNVRKAREFFAQSTNDTGSVEVQCGQLTVKIIALGEHCAQHKHDYKSQRKIVELVAIRRRFLKYLRRVSLQRYFNLLDKLSLPPNYLEAFEASCSYKSKKQNKK